MRTSMRTHSPAGMARRLLPLLLVALALMATASHAAFGYNALPPSMWTNSQYTVVVDISESPLAGGGDRLTLVCPAAAATVTPAAGFSMSQARKFTFVVTTGAEATSGECVLTRDSEWYGPMAPVSMPFTLEAQRTLTVSPASSAESPIIVGTSGVGALTFTLSDDLGSEPQVQVQCTSLAMNPPPFTIAMVSGPVVAEVRMGESVGLVECHYTVTNRVDYNELATPAGHSFFKIIPTVRLVATIDGAEVNPWMPESLAPSTTYWLSVAPPSPLNFGLQLYCMNPDMNPNGPGEPVVTFTDASAGAQSLNFTTPAAPATGSSLIIWCNWYASGDAFKRRIVDIPGGFNFYMGDAVAVTTGGDLQVNAAGSWRTTVTLTAPAGTVFAETGLTFFVQCSAGSMSPDTVTLSNTLTATATYNAEPVLGVATTPKCTFKLRELGDYRRVKVPVADVTFDVAAYVAPLQLVVKGLPTAADALVAGEGNMAEPEGVIDWATATAGVPITLATPVGLAADVSAVIGLVCSAPRYGATVAVTPSPAEATLDGSAPSGATFTVAITRADPAVANALSDLITCRWSVVEGDASQFTLPTDFSFVVGSAVQLEVRQDLSNGASPFSGVVQGLSASFYLQSAGLLPALVGEPFQLAASCGPCGTGDHTGEGFVQNNAFQVTDAFPRGPQNDQEFMALSPGVVTCHWSFPARFPWSRAFLPPVPTSITVLPAVLLDVRGIPTALDALPRVSGEAPYFFPSPATPGQVFTISMPAAPVEAVFGAETNVFNLVCNGPGEVSGPIVYSEGARGPHSVTLTMPLLTEGQPVEVECSFVIDWSSGRGPLTVASGSARPRFRLAVVDPLSPTVLTPRLVESAPLFAGGESHVVLDSSATVRATGELYIDVSCAMSPVVSVDGMTLASNGIADLVSSINTEGDLITFRFRALDAPLTAGTADPALVFGYKLGLPTASTTLTCTHTLMPTVNGPRQSFGRADRVLSVASEPVVITVLASQSITVTSAPTDPLGGSPANQTLTVQPNLRANAVLEAGRMLQVTLNCPGLGLPNDGLLTFVGTGQSSIDAQSIEVAVPAVFPGAGNVWLCSWQLGGTDGPFFQTPAAFQIVVGLVDSWTAEMSNPSAGVFVEAYRPARLIAPGNVPASGIVTAKCDKGCFAEFVRTEGWSTDFSVADAQLDLNVFGNTANTCSCRFVLSGLPAGFPMLPPAPLTWTVVPQATFTLSGLSSPGVMRIDGGVGAPLTIAPTETPGAGGVTLTIGCDSNSDESLSTSVSSVFFPTGSAEPQSIHLGLWNVGPSFVAQCSFQVQGGAGQFAQPEPLVVELNTDKAVLVGGLDEHGRVMVPTACEDAVFTVGPSVPPSSNQGPFVLGVTCENTDSDFVTPNELTFTQTAWQPISVTVRGRGVPFVVRCTVTEENGCLPETRFAIVFGRPPLVAIGAPSFVPLGTTAPVTLRTPPGVFVSSSGNTYLRAQCLQGQIYAPGFSPEGNGMSMEITREARFELLYTATGRRAPAASAASVGGARSAVTMALPRSVRAKNAFTSSVTKKPLRTNKKEEHEKKRRAAKALAVGDAAVPNELVTCFWEMQGTDASRFSLQPSSTFLVGSAVEMTGQLADGAVSAMQGRTVSLIVAPTTATPVDVTVDVVCSAGVSASAPTVTLVADAVGSQSVTLTVAADAAPGAASCTLTPSGAGRLAVSNSPTVAFAIEPAPVVSSSTGGGSAASGSSTASSESTASGSSSSTAGDAASSSSTASGSVTSGSTASGSSTASDSTASASTASDSPTSGSTGGDSAASGSTAGGSTGSQSADTGAPFSSPSSSGGDDGTVAISSSTGTKPCGGDFECGAFAAVSLPGLAALAAMLLAAALAQRQ